MTLHRFCSISISQTGSIGRCMRGLYGVLGSSVTFSLQGKHWKEPLMTESSCSEAFAGPSERDVEYSGSWLFKNSKWWPLAQFHCSFSTYVSGSSVLITGATAWDWVKQPDGGGKLLHESLLSLQQKHYSFIWKDQMITYYMFLSTQHSHFLESIPGLMKRSDKKWWQIPSQDKFVQTENKTMTNE